MASNSYPLFRCLHPTWKKGKQIKENLTAFTALLLFVICALDPLGFRGTQVFRLLICLWPVFYAQTSASVCSLLGNTKASRLLKPNMICVQHIHTDVHTYTHYIHTHNNTPTHTPTHLHRQFLTPPHIHMEVTLPVYNIFTICHLNKASMLVLVFTLNNSNNYYCTSTTCLSYILSFHAYFPVILS